MHLDRPPTTVTAKSAEFFRTVPAEKSGPHLCLCVLAPCHFLP